MSGIPFCPLYQALFVIETLVMIALATLAFWNLPEYPNIIPKILLSVGIAQACFYYNNLYHFSQTQRFHELALRILQAMGVTVLVLLSLYYVFPNLLIGRGIFLMMMALFAGFAFTWRWILYRLAITGHLSKRVLILGSGKAALAVLNYLIHPQHRFANDLIGFLNEDYENLGPTRSFSRALGSYKDFLKTALQERVELIVVAVDDRRGHLPLSELAECKLRGIEVVDATQFMESEESMIAMVDLRPSWLIFSSGFRQSRVTFLLKQVSELVLALSILALTAPLMVLIAILIQLDSKGPILYRQIRVGAKGSVFTLLKFRSMRTDAENDGAAKWAEENDSRITRVGRFLRTYRLDELPQLVNVIKGEMSLVGPRPERPQFVNELLKKIPCYSQRLAVKPGVTGLAQVRLRYGASVDDAEKKLEYDLYYVKHLSIFLDFSILIDTFKVVLLGKGAR